MNVPWAELELFLAVAETGSFTGAAERLGLTQPTVSRRIAALEENLGCSLFRRSVGGAQLTEDGDRLRPAAEQMARWAAEAARALSAKERALAGSVRIAAPPGIAYDLLVPFARDLRTSLPGVHLEVVTGVEHLDLARGQADLALRARRPAQADLIVAAAFGVTLGVFASRAYVRGRRCNQADSQSPAELDWITWGYPNEHVFPRPELERAIEAFSPVFASNDYLAQQRALTEGLGVMVLPRTQDPDQSFRRLVELRVNLPLPPAELYLVCAKAMRWVPRVAAVVSALEARIGRIEGVAPS